MGMTACYLPAGTARGLAVHESFGSVVAQVAEVTRSISGAWLLMIGIFEDRTGR